MTIDPDAPVPSSCVPLLDDTVVLQWPDPSPLTGWWNEIMDGALLPVPGADAA